MWDGLDGGKGRGKWHNYNIKNKRKMGKRICDVIWEFSKIGSLHRHSPSNYFPPKTLMKTIDLFKRYYFDP